MILQIWENYKRFAEQRGELVAKILHQFTDLQGKEILDVGCGDGATAAVLSRHGAKVTGLEPQNSEISNPAIRLLHESFEDFDGDAQMFDIIIMQDVLEHLPDAAVALKKSSRLLKKGGLLYIATPNRFSIINLFCDPHWQLPLVSILPRNGVKFLVNTVFRKDRRQRMDWAALISLNKLVNLLKKNNFRIKFVNNFVADQLFTNPPSVVCAPGHLKIVEIVKRNHWQNRLVSLVSDSLDFFNNFINPTWYVIGLKK